MRRATTGALLFFTAAACLAAQSPEGRWEGVIRIPGADQPVVVDIASAGSAGWEGSIILPGLGIKGAPLLNIVVRGTEASFDAGSELSDAKTGPAHFTVHPASADAMAGTMRLSGNVASLSLARIGPPQVELPVKSTAVGSDIAREWSGEFELGGYPRRVTITLENHADAAATATFVIVGKRTNDVPVDLVVQDGESLRIESHATQVVFEGRVVAQASEIKGTIELGSLELPVVLRCVGGKS
ncbi:MAG TPA: hypothetical protein VMU96_00010 [Casimicrobiaceae bacterium]|nr:hypothetical protein [Casimicrobiaceae bacterium]